MQPGIHCQFSILPYSEFVFGGTVPLGRAGNNSNEQAGRLDFSVIEVA